MRSVPRPCVSHPSAELVQYRQAGTRCDELKDLGGWKSHVMVDRYAKFGTERCGGEDRARMRQNVIDLSRFCHSPKAQGASARNGRRRQRAENGLTWHKTGHTRGTHRESNRSHRGDARRHSCAYVTRLACADNRLQRVMA